MKLENKQECGGRATERAWAIGVTQRDHAECKPECKGTAICLPYADLKRAHGITTHRPRHLARDGVVYKADTGTHGARPPTRGLWVLIVLCARPPGGLCVVC